MKKIWIKTTALFLALTMLAGMMVGCGGGAPADPEEEQIATYPLKLYYVSSAYLESGDESIDPMVIEDTKVEVSLEETDEIYDTTLELLVQVPDEKNDTMVRQGMVKDVTVTEGVAVVDFNEDQMYGGSMEEVYLIEQVVRTLVKSFDEIQKVRFTVEGSEVESLMGHLEANCTYGLITVQEDGADVELVSIMED